MIRLFCQVPGIHKEPHLFNKASMAKLLYKILDSDATKLKLNKRSAAFKMLGSIN